MFTGDWPQTIISNRIVRIRSNSVRIERDGVNSPTGCTRPLCRIVTSFTTQRVIS